MHCVKDEHHPRTCSSRPYTAALGMGRRPIEAPMRRVHPLMHRVHPLMHRRHRRTQRTPDHAPSTSSYAARGTSSSRIVARCTRPHAHPHAAHQRRHCHRCLASSRLWALNTHLTTATQPPQAIDDALQGVQMRPHHHRCRRIRVIHSLRRSRSSTHCPHQRSRTPLTALTTIESRVHNAHRL